MSELDEIRAMATRFFDAIEAGDIATMQGSFTPDAEIWHNSDELIVTQSLRLDATNVYGKGHKSNIHFAGQNLIDQNFAGSRSDSDLGSRMLLAQFLENSRQLFGQDHRRSTTDPKSAPLGPCKFSNLINCSIMLAQDVSRTP